MSCRYLSELDLDLVIPMFTGLFSLAIALVIVAVVALSQLICRAFWRVALWAFPVDREYQDGDNDEDDEEDEDDDQDEDDAETIRDELAKIRADYLKLQDELTLSRRNAREWEGLSARRGETIETMSGSFKALEAVLNDTYEAGRKYQTLLCAFLEMDAVALTIEQLDRRLTVKWMRDAGCRLRQHDDANEPLREMLRKVDGERREYRAAILAFQGKREAEGSDEVFELPDAAWMRDAGRRLCHLDATNAGLRERVDELIAGRNEKSARVAELLCEQGVRDGLIAELKSYLAHAVGVQTTSIDAMIAGGTLTPAYFQEARDLVERRVRDARVDGQASGAAKVANQVRAILQGNPS